MVFDRSKPFALFGGSAFYPNGGWDDFKGAFPSRDAAIASVTDDDFMWAQVVDMQTGKTVAEFRSPHQVGEWELHEPPA